VRAVVLTSGDEGYRSARLLWDAGAEVTVVDLRSADALPAIDGIRSLPGQTILSAHGRRRVKAVTVGPPGARTGSKIECDLVVFATPTALTSLFPVGIFAGTLVIDILVKEKIVD
jgi:hypothetical protein